MSCAEQQVKEIATLSTSNLLDEMKLLGEVQANPSAKKVLNSELWHACAGPLVSLPQPGSLVYYFPQGHSEQVSASTRRTTNSQIPSYPNLPSQLMCQVHNVTLHADKDTDEIYAQMTLQPVNSEADVFQIPDFGHTKSKQPTEFFCKNLTASDTSTHGGFSVPRRAAEKLFPQLDYTMQPPNQELIVRDLHENEWTFRHIYRGQPKRHLLTTGWSLFVGAKRLKAGDSVLFVRDEKSQLLLGVRRCNRQQITLPSSVLSADTMHIGVLAAAAHAAASCSPFTVYYNPRACPSEFIIPLAKYHKAAYTPVSIGMRFGMMFETEESSKRRYMGTVVGINDFDSIRWPNSKWHNLQVEWDESGYGERPDRVNIWEIETPESLFIFPPSLKRQCIPGFVVPGSDTGFENVKPSLQALENGNGDLHPSLSNFCSEQLMMLTKPPSSLPGSEFGCHPSVYAVILQKIKSNGFSEPSSSTLEAVMATQSAMQHDEAPMKRDRRERDGSLGRKHQAQPLDSTSLEDLNSYHSIEEHDLLMASKLVVQHPAEIPLRSYQELNEHADICENSLVNEKIDKSESTSHAAKNEWKEPSRNKLKASPDLIGPHCLIKLTEECEKSPVLSGEENIGNEFYRNPMFGENEEIPSIETANQLNKNILNNQPYQGGQSSQYTDNDDEWMLQPSLYQSFADSIKTPDFFSNSSIPGHLSVSVVENAASPSADISSILMNSETVNSFETCHFSCFPDNITPTFMPILLEETQTSQAQNLKVGASEACSNLNTESINANIFSTSCVSSSVLEGFSAVKGSSFFAPSEDLFGCLALNQDIHSQVTSTSIADSQVLSLQDIPDTSGGTSSGSIDANDHNLLSKGTKKQIVPHPMRTFTKVQKFGSVGRSIDVTRFRNYRQLNSAIARMFGLEGQLDDPICKEWKLVYVDYENDVLLVGDDPWEEFVNCVRCIRILSPTEVQQMSQEGLQFMNSYQP